MTDAAVSTTDIAIIGMACRLPGARTPDEFWANIVASRESVVPIDDEALRAAGVSEELIADPAYVKVHAPIPDLRAFDAGFFGFSPREAAILDPQHRHFLETAWEAFEDAGQIPGRFNGAIGVFAGSGQHHYFAHHLLPRADLLRNVGYFLLRHTGNDKDFLPTRVSYLLNLRGPSMAVQTACSTSLVAVHLGVQSLLNGECDMVLAGGVTIELPESHGYRFAEGEILSPDGHCRPFDADSQGTVFGSGCGAVVLRRLADAIADGDTIHAIIKGSAINNDGAQKVGYLAPSVEGQARVASEALALADVDPSTVTYIEAHGTGTPVGDPIEIAALTQAYGAAPRASIAIGSVKSNIGHTDTAAGVASLIKVVQALRHRTLPPTLHFRSPNPACAFEAGPFRVQHVAAPWAASGVRRAGVSSLGVGGTNAHVILEEAPRRAAAVPAREGPALLPLSARTPAALTRAATRLAEALERDPSTAMRDVAWTLQTGREAFPHRLTIVADGTADAIAKLQDTQALDRASRKAAAASPDVVYLFAGGGAQFPGMGEALYESEPVFRRAIDDGLAQLRTRHGLDLRPLLFPAREHAEAAARDLERPSRSLCAIYLVQVATARLWQSWGVLPSALLGHSMGEYSAAHIAGVLTFEDGLDVVHKRGELFETVPQGGMLSVARSAAEVRSWLDPRLAIAAENAPELCVVAGPEDALHRFEQQMVARDIDVTRIRIRIAAHSPMLDPILPAWRAFLKTIRFQAPTMPLMSNLSGRLLEAGEAVDPEYWVRQLRETVRFSDGIGSLLTTAPALFIECGPGRTLTSLTRQHPAHAAQHELVTSLRRPDSDQSDRVAMLTALGMAWTAGATPDWKAVHQAVPGHRLSLPTYPFERAVHWIDRVEPAEASAPPADPLERRADVGAWCTQTGWRRTASTGVTAARGTLLVIGDPHGFGGKVAAAWRRAGGEAVLAVPGLACEERAPGEWSFRPAHAEDWQTVISAGGPMAVIAYTLATSLPDDALDIHQFDAAHTRAFDGLAALGIAAAQDGLGDATRLVVAIEGGADPDDATPASVMSALGAGISHVLARELDGVRVIVADVGADGGQAAELVDAFIHELASDSTDEVIALRGNRRWIRTFEPMAPLSEPVGVLPKGAVCVVTGGTGGVGLELAAHLGERFGARVAIIGRSAATAAQRPEVAAALARIANAGGDVQLFAADVTDAAAMRDAIEGTTRAWGRIDAVFHAAGLLDDRLLGQKRIEEMHRVLAPKTIGTLTLAAAIAPHSPALLVLFSSISAIAGVAGQADYAAANAFQDAYARWRAQTAPGRTVAIGWGAWRDVGMLVRSALSRATPLAPTNGLLTHVETGAGETRDLLGELSTAQDWLLDEHRLSTGESLLPGTGFVELARQAAADGLGDGPIEVTDLTFRSSFAVTDALPRAIRVRTTPMPGGTLALEVAGAREAGWEVHALGHAAPLASARPAARDLAAERRKAGAPAPGPLHRSPFLAFGPRWNVVERAAIGPAFAWMDCRLPDAYTAEAAQFFVHPALLDLATAGAQSLLPGFEVATDFLVPLSYGSIRFWESTGSAFTSLVELTSSEEGTATFDVTLVAADGRVLVEVRDFTMIRIADGRSLVARTSAPAKRSIAEGIGAHEGMCLLDRIIGQPTLPQFYVTPQPLHAVLEDLRRTPSAAPDAAGVRAVADDSAPELEAILRTIDGVVSAAARRLMDDSGEPRLVAYIVAAPGTTVTASVVRRAVRAAGADSLVPQTVLDVDTLPLDARGVVQHAALPNPFGTTKATVLPRTDAERAIATLWRELLGVDAVGVHDNFFDIGGHSLLAVRLINRLHKAVGVRIRHEDLVVNTLEQLAVTCETAAVPSGAT